MVKLAPRRRGAGHLADQPGRHPGRPPGRTRTGPSPSATWPGGSGRRSRAVSGQCGLLRYRTHRRWSARSSTPPAAYKRQSMAGARLLGSSPARGSGWTAWSATSTVTWPWPTPSTSCCRGRRKHTNRYRGPVGTGNGQCIRGVLSRTQVVYCGRSFTAAGRSPSACPRWPGSRAGSASQQLADISPSEAGQPGQREGGSDGDEHHERHVGQVGRWQLGRAFERREPLKPSGDTERRAQQPDDEADREDGPRRDGPTWREPDERNCEPDQQPHCGGVDEGVADQVRNDAEIATDDAVAETHMTLIH